MREITKFVNSVGVRLLAVINNRNAVLVEQGRACPRMAHEDARFVVHGVPLEEIHYLWHEQVYLP